MAITASPTADLPTLLTAPKLVIQPARGWPKIDFGELWSYRGLFFFLAWRDIKVRYAQTVLGAGWAVLQPLATMLIFSVVFGGLAQIPSDGIPYPVFSLAALVPWMYFSQALSAASTSLATNSNLLTKVYFPRLIIPFSSVLVGLVDFGISFTLLLVMIVAFGLVPSATAVVTVPLLLLALLLTASGLGCGLAALNIQYRDVRPVTAFVIQAWMYASPVVYPMSLVPERLQPLYMLNPMVGVIEGFRAVLLGTRDVPWLAIGVSLLVGLALFAAGTRYFRRVEEIFADVA